MIVENALITIDPERAADFEAAVAQAVSFFQASPGCLGMALQRVIENPAQYRLVVRWETLAHHMTSFRNSANFQSWRSLVGPFIVKSPEVDHGAPVAQYFEV